MHRIEERWDRRRDAAGEHATSWSETRLAAETTDAWPAQRLSSTPTTQVVAMASAGEQLDPHRQEDRPQGGLRRCPRRPPRRGSGRARRGRSRATNPSGPPTTGMTKNPTTAEQHRQEQRRAAHAGLAHPPPGQGVLAGHAGQVEDRSRARTPTSRGVEPCPGPERGQPPRHQQSPGSTGSDDPHQPDQDQDGGDPEGGLHGQGRRARLPLLVGSGGRRLGSRSVSSWMSACSRSLGRCSRPWWAQNSSSPPA